VTSTSDGKDGAPGPARRRQGRAARNDDLILDAARSVFLADPAAPIAAVAEAAGVGMAALYRRYPGKDVLVRALWSEGLRRTIEASEAALADEHGAWDAFDDWMHRLVVAGTPALVQRLAGRVAPTPDDAHALARAGQLIERVVDRARASGSLRRGVEAGDVVVILEMVTSLRSDDASHTAQLRRRYLGLMLDGLRAASGGALEGAAPAPADHLSASPMGAGLA
jgi:AcrR family transcriptional regulator